MRTWACIPITYRKSQVWSHILLQCQRWREWDGRRSGASWLANLPENGELEALWDILRIRWKTTDQDPWSPSWPVHMCTWVHTYAHMHSTYTNTSKGRAFLCLWKRCVCQEWLVKDPLPSNSYVSTKCLKLLPHCPGQHCRDTGW